MSDDNSVGEKTIITRWSQHRFLLMIGLAIATSLFLVGVALALYASSGAAQLDLSRPGYTSVREKAPSSDKLEGFSANGAIDKATIEQFRQVYDNQATKATSVDSFGGSVMSDQTLQIDDAGTGN